MRKRRSRIIRVILCAVPLVIVLLILIPSFAQGQERIPIPRIGITLDEAEGPRDVALSLEILFLLTVLTLAPAIIISVTSFTRIAIVFSFIRRALSTQQEPPNQVMMGLALFLTIFIMAPTIGQVNNIAIRPYFSNEINAVEMYQRGIVPIREFMFRQTREKDIALFLRLGDLPRPANQAEVPTWVLVPSFMISELTTAFKIGILLFIPFIVIDLVVASTLMSMGIIFLPPVMISLPLKIVLFILVDGWHLLTFQIVNSFR
ncbi:MAG: flagellar biosynthesis protein flip [Spirochaetes bacterium DG_61]|jgi:flagellar biosynthetic protein FliP|nr:MAG: flagellar biosynthesis protein flip [Spirochaetes bacterium DG_61]